MEDQEVKQANGEEPSDSCTIIVPQLGDLKDKDQGEETKGSAGKEEEVSEKCPLKEPDEVDIAVDVIATKENDTNAAAAAAQVTELRYMRLRAWLAKQQVKWFIAIVVAFVLLTVVLMSTLLAIDGTPERLQDNRPRLMSVWPRPNKPDDILFLRYGSEARHQEDGWQPLADQLDQLMAGYRNGDHATLNKRNVTECFGAFPTEGYSCFFDTSLVTPECTSAHHYGYRDGTPCVFLRFNNFTGWKPESYTPRELDSDDQFPPELKFSYKPNLVYLDCRGETLIDQENIGPVDYTPERGFKFNYFPYNGQQGYMPPMVAVRFRKPAVGVAISVVCKLWAKNINHTEYTVPSGTLHFTLLLE